MFKISKIKKIKKIKNYSVIIIPDETSREPRSLKITSIRLISYFITYSLIVFFLGFYIISYTPLNEVLLPYSLRLTDSDKKKVDVLNKKLNILASEIELLKSVNQRLKFAIMLGDSTLIKDIPVIKDSTKKNIKADGNLLAVVLTLLNKYYFIQNDNLFFLKPVQGFISREFDPDRGHNGYDYAVKENTPVSASAAGYIVFADYTPRYGYTIIINHKDNYVTKYSHCYALIKKEGESVQQGELIALSGNSGTDSTGPHLHFEIWRDGNPINPKSVLIKY